VVLLRSLRRAEGCAAARLTVADTHLSGTQSNQSTVAACEGGVVLHLSPLCGTRACLIPDTLYVLCLGSLLLFCARYTHNWGAIHFFRAVLLEVLR
jgi:hypothetical protein